MILLQIIATILFTDLLASIEQCVSAEIKKYAIELLFPFYEKRDGYGPKVVIALVNCLGQVAKVSFIIRALLFN